MKSSSIFFLRVNEDIQGAQGPRLLDTRKETRELEMDKGLHCYHLFANSTALDLFSAMILDRGHGMTHIWAYLGFSATLKELTNSNLLCTPQESVLEYKGGE